MIWFTRGRVDQTEGRPGTRRAGGWFHLRQGLGPPTPNAWRTDGSSCFVADGDWPFGLDKRFCPYRTRVGRSPQEAAPSHPAGPRVLRVSEHGAGDALLGAQRFTQLFV